MAEFVVTLILLLVGAKLLGEVAQRLGLPSLAGYVAAGIAAGPIGIGLASEEAVRPFAELGAIMLLFITGFEQGNIRQLFEERGAILLTSGLGYFFPFLAALVVGLAFGFPFAALLLLMVAVASTDSSTTIRTVASIGRLASRPGRILLGVVVSDSITSLMVLTTVVTFLTVGGVSLASVAQTVLLVILFLALFMLLQRFVPKLVEAVEHLTVEQAEFSFAFVFMIVLAVAAQLFGLHGVVGAFLAGVLLSHSPMSGTGLIEKLSAISYAIFIPLFFAWTGLLLDASAISLFSFVLAGAVLIANVLGVYFASRIAGLPDDDAVTSGIAMLPRGDINLVVAAIGLTLVDAAGRAVLPARVAEELYSSVILLILFSLVITALLLRVFVRRK
jgi:Kef-type K+ transport system membrane component KefB